MERILSTASVERLIHHAEFTVTPAVDGDTPIHEDIFLEKSTPKYLDKKALLDSSVFSTIIHREHFFIKAHKISGIIS